MPNSRQKLYNALSNKFDLGSFNEFNTKMDDANSRQKLYNSVSKDFDLGSFDEFNSKIGGVKKKSSLSNSSVGSSNLPKNNSPITQVSNVLDTSFNEKSKKPQQSKRQTVGTLPISNTNNLGQSLYGTLGNAPSLFQEYQQAKSLSADEQNSVKQELDDEINNKGLMNNITNLAKDWWNGVFSQEPGLEIEKNPLAKNLQEVQERYGSKITPEEATKIAYDMELDKRSASLSESKERAYLKSAQDSGKIESIKKEQIKVYDERSKQYNESFLKDGALKLGLKEQGESLVKLKNDIDKLDPKSTDYANKVNEFATLKKQYENTYKEYETNNVSLKKLGSEVSGFEHNLDMLKRDYGYWSNFTHTVANAFADAGKGYVSTIIETPADLVIGALGDKTPQAVKDIKQASKDTRINYEANRDYRSNKHAKPIEIDDIKSPADFGAWGLNLLASQSYNLLAAGAGGTTGLVGIGVNSGGQKRTEMLGEIERGADYNLAQQLTVPILSGGAEMIGGLVDRFNLRSAGAIVKSATASERSLIAKGMASEFGKNYLKGTSAEFTEETGVQIFQNVMDIAVLGKTDVNPLDGVKEAAAGALFLSSAIQGTGGLTGMAIKGLQPFSYDDKISKLSKEILSLEAQLERGELNESDTKIATDRIEVLRKNSEKALQDKIGTVQSLSNEDFQEVLKLEKDQVALRTKAETVKKSNINADAKKSILKELEVEFKANDEKRIALLKNTTENAPKTEETPTEQKEETTTENIKTTTESEYNAEEDLDFIEGLEDVAETETNVVQDTESEITTDANQDVVSEDIPTADLPSETIAENEVNEIQDQEIENDTVVVEDKAEFKPVELKVSEKGETYTTSKVDDAIVFRDKNGKEPSAPTRRKLQKEYIKTQDFTQGKLADESEMEYEKNMNQVIAKHSENPTQIAEAIVNINNYDYESDLTYKYVGISDYLKKVNRDSFIRFGDKNYITFGIAKQYIAKKGEGQHLDSLAQEISSDFGVEVTPEDIVDFIVEYPSGIWSFKNQQKSQDLNELKYKFEQLTGLPATDTVLQSVIENSKDIIAYQKSLSSLDVYSIEDLIQLYNERQEWESSVDRSREITNENQDSRNDGEISGVQGESTEDGRGEKEKSKSEPSGIDLATDEELQKLVDNKNIFDEILNTLDTWEKGINYFGQGHLSMGIPLVIAKEAIKAMRLATKTTKVASEIVKAGYDYLIQTDWYKDLTEKQKSKITLSNFKNLIAESIRQITKAEKEISNLSKEINDLREKLANNKIEALEVSKMIKDFLKSNKITGKVTPTEINRLVMYANKISTSKDKIKAFDDFVNTFNKIDKKAQDRLVKLSDRQRVEKRIKKELDKGTTENEIIELFKEDSSARKIAEDYFERTKTRTDDEIRNKLNRAVEDHYSEKYKKKSLSSSVKKGYEKVVEAFFDRMFSVKKAMNKAGMRYSTSLLIATKGAPGYANYIYTKAHNKIFAGLTNEQTDNLNLIIRLRRIIAIENDGEQKGKDPMVHTMNFNKQQAEQGLRVLENDLGATEFAALQERANYFYKEQKDLLTQLYDNGIISEEFYNDMKDVEYIKTRYLDFLTEADQQSFDLQKGASTNSGIVKMSNGWNGTVELNANELLAQSIQTTVKAIATNRLNKNLVEEFSQNKSEVDLLREKQNKTKAEKQRIKDFDNIDGKIIPSATVSARPPHNYTKVTYYDQGEQKTMFIENAFYNIFADNIGSMWGSGNVKEIVQTAMGVKLVKTIATGQNPTFFITNTPRDFIWILNTSMEYSSNILVGGYQLTKDFFEGSKDVVKDSVNYQKAVEYGLMMDFLHLQGKLKFDVNPRSFIGKTLTFLGENKGSKAIQYLWQQGLVLGKYSEIGFRMAVFNRSTNNLLNKFNEANKTNFKSVESIDEKLYPNAKERIYTEAVVIARESTVDFNQGGHLSKDFEAMIPYFNAATQGTRMLVEKVAENPLQTTLRFTQTAAVISGVGIGLSMWILNGLKDDDEDVIDAYNNFYSGVSKFDRANYMVIPIGRKDGEYEYTRIAMPQALTPYLAFTRGVTHDAINKYFEKEKARSFTFSDTDFAFTKNLIPIEFSVAGNASKVPMLKSAFSYVTGYDFFREQQVSLLNGKVPEKAEGFESKSIEGFYKEIGREFDMSPARTKVATEALITSPGTNIGVGVAYGLMNLALSNDKNDKSASDLINKSLLGRVKKSTSDFNRKASNTEEFKDRNDEISTYKVIQEYEAKTVVDRFHAKEITKTQATKEFKEIFGSDDKNRINNFTKRLDFNAKDYSGTSLEIKYAQKETKGELLYEYFGKDLYNEGKLNTEQQKLRKELRKLKVFTPSTRTYYQQAVKRNKAGN